MRFTRFIPAVLALITACSSASDNADPSELDALRKRVSMLEKRMRVAERRLPGATNARPKAAQPGGRGARATIALGGDAGRVVLANARREFPIPGDVPGGRYTIWATFGDGEKIRAGRVEVAPGSAVDITCDATTGACETAVTRAAPAAKPPEDGAE